MKDLIEETNARQNAAAQGVNGYNENVETAGQNHIPEGVSRDCGKSISSLFPLK
jgi:hypothetical protein